MRHSEWHLLVMGAGLLSLGVGACACGGRVAAKKPLAEAPAARGEAPASALWTVRIGSEGGFTGGGSGQVIRSDGVIESWSQITPDEFPMFEPAGHATAATLEALFRAMSSAELRSVEYRGNMTGFLEWRHGAEVRRWSWAETMRGEKIPEPVKRAYEAALAVVNSAQH